MKTFGGTMKKEFVFIVLIIITTVLSCNYKPYKINDIIIYETELNSINFNEDKIIDIDDIEAGYYEFIVKGKISIKNLENFKTINIDIVLEGEHQKKTINIKGKNFSVIYNDENQDYYKIVKLADTLIEEKQFKTVKIKFIEFPKELIVDNSFIFKGSLQK